MKKIVLVIFSLTAIVYTFRGGVRNSSLHSQTSIAKESTQNKEIAAPPAASAATAFKIRTAVMPKPAEEKALQEIQVLSRMVLAPQRKVNELRPLLDNPALMNNIYSSLNDPNSFSGEAFTRKLRLLDALFEGMKFPEPKLQRKYEHLASEIMNEPAPEGFDIEMARQFRADRVEIALAVTKRMPEIVSRLTRSDDARKAFSQATDLQSLYEVAL